MVAFEDSKVGNTFSGVLDIVTMQVKNYGNNINMILQ